MELERFLSLDEHDLRRLIERRLRWLKQTAAEVPYLRERRSDLIEYGRELGPYAYRLDAIEGLRLFALAAELECLDARDELRGFAGDLAGIAALPEISV